MFQQLEVVANLINRWNQKLGQFIAWLTLCMVLVTFCIVLLRYGFNLGWIAMQESVVYMHSAVFMLGAAFTLQHNGHVRVDIFYHKMSRKAKAWVDLLGGLFLLYPTVIFIIWMSWQYVYSSWVLLEGSREPGGLSGVFIFKTFIPLMGLLLFAQGTAHIMQNIILIFKGDQK